MRTRKTTGLVCNDVALLIDHLVSTCNHTNTSFVQSICGAPSSSNGSPDCVYPRLYKIVGEVSLVLPVTLIYALRHSRLIEWNDLHLTMQPQRDFRLCLVRFVVTVLFQNSPQPFL